MGPFIFVPEEKAIDFHRISIFNSLTLTNFGNSPPELTLITKKA